MNSSRLSSVGRRAQRPVQIVSALTLGLGLILALLLALAAATMPAHAGTICVKQGGGDGCEQAIQDALEVAQPGDTILVAAGVYEEYVLITETVTLQGSWSPDFSVRDLSQYTSTIKPPINMVNPQSVVSIQGQFADPAAVAPTLDGFEITGGRADLGSNHGGGLKVTNSNANVISNTIRDNRAFYLGGGVWVQNGAPHIEGNRIEGNLSDGLGQEAYGGGVQLENAQATLVDNLITHNVVSGTQAYGGGIDVLGGGPITLQNNEIVSNTAGQGSANGFGGGIAMQNAALELVGGIVSGNESREDGGGLYVSGPLTVTGATIAGNVAIINGGGIHFDGIAAGLVISDSALIGNSAVMRGGGVHFDALSPVATQPAPTGLPESGSGITLPGTMAIVDTRISGNVSGDDGGGVSQLSGVGLKVTNAVFEQNQSDGSGGGTSVFLTSDLLIESSTFSGNQAGDGGGVQFSGQTAWIQNSTFEGNSALFNAGAIINSGTLTVTNSTIISNTAGDNAGAIENGHEMTISDSVISENTAGDQAGAIQNNMDDELILAQSVINDNVAAASGGAIYNSNGGSVRILASAISGNTADSDNDAMGDGGGIYNRGQVELTGSTLSANQAASFGGGIFNDDVFTATNALIRANQADDGGGIFAEGDSATAIFSSTVSGNTTIMGGGAGINNNGRLTVQASTFSSNQTTSMNGNGGGILNNDMATIINSTVSGNLAEGFGGGIRNAGTVTLTNVTVYSNTGGLGAGGVQNMNVALVVISILAANSPDNCSDPVTSLGHNLEDTDTCGLEPTLNDVIGLNPLVGTLADNGGPSPTHALLAGSPAIDAGTNAACPPTDQRGGFRPVDGDDNGSAICDIGAYEYGAIPELLYLPLVLR